MKAAKMDYLCPLQAFIAADSQAYHGDHTSRSTTRPRAKGTMKNGTVDETGRRLNCAIAFTIE